MMLCKALVDACRNNPEVARQVKTQWQQVFDALIAFKEARRHENHLQVTDLAECAVHSWNALGKGLCGLGGETPPGGVARDHGCSWYKCPLYESKDVASGRKMMRCERCKQVSFVSMVGRSYSGPWSNRCVRCAVPTGPVLRVPLPNEVSDELCHRQRVTRY